MATVLRLLGEVALRSADRSVDLGSPRQRCVLVALAVDAGRTVPVQRVVHRVWGEDAEERARATLHSYVSRLRRALAAADGLGIVRRSGGYALTVDASATVDLLEFRGLRDRAHRADGTQAQLLREALAWWHGEPFGGLTGMWVEAERDRLLRERVAVEYDLVDLRLRDGDGSQLVPELSARAASHPLDERVAAQYVLALHQSGRTAEALEEYRRTRARLVDELGTEPGTALRAAHQRVLHTVPVEPETAPAVAVPHQLPAAPAAFIGRADELALLDAAAAECGTRAVVVALAGAGGMGKTWLVVHWARLHAERFPDGQLFVNLNGFGPTGEPLSPAAVLGGFLGALGIGAAQLPVEEHARTALLRSLIAGRRVLLILDNAVDTAQVLPLLPGDASCLVLVTSRHMLPGLLAGHGATHLPVDVLPERVALELLSTRLGAGRTREEGAAVRELARHCGGYPLALAVVAGRVATEPGLALAAVAAELREATVDALRSDDPTASVSAVLDASCRALGDEQLVAFELLAIAPGPDIGPQAAAHLIGVAQPRADAILRELAQASLIGRSSTGRFRIHDLIRQHATAAVRRDLPGETRTAALRRVIDYYLHTARAAHHLIFANEMDVPFEAPYATCCPHSLPHAQAALAFLDAEHACLLAAQRTAAELGWDTAVWRIAWVLSIFHQLRGNSHDQLTVWLAALAASERLGDRVALLHSHRYVGHTRAQHGAYDEALEHLGEAVHLAVIEGDSVAESLIHRVLSMVHEQHGDLPSAAVHSREAVRSLREVGESVSLARALGGLGWDMSLLGRHDEGERYCREAYELFQRFPDASGEAGVLDSLGYLAHRAGRHIESVEYYRRSLALQRTLEYSYGVAEVLRLFGEPLAELGRYDEVRAAWLEAIELFRREGRAQKAMDLMAQLEGLPDAAASSAGDVTGDR